MQSATEKAGGISWPPPATASDPDQSAQTPTGQQRRWTPETLDGQDGTDPNCDQDGTATDRHDSKLVSKKRYEFKLNTKAWGL